jgi:mycothione reductase
MCDNLGIIIYNDTDPSNERYGLAMREYDLISTGTGSAMHIVDAMLQRNPNLKVAFIDKDEPGGICLT